MGVAQVESTASLAPASWASAAAPSMSVIPHNGFDGDSIQTSFVAPVRIAVPFQTIETVNEPAQDRLRTLDLFAQDNLRSGAGQIVNQFRGK